MNPFPYQRPGLTFRQFCERVRHVEDGHCFVEYIRDPFSNIDALYKFTRITANGSGFEIIEYIEDDDWELMPSTFRSLCARLQIDPDTVRAEED